MGIFYFACAKNQANLRGSGGGLSQNWLISYGMTTKQKHFTSKNSNTVVEIS